MLALSSGNFGNSREEGSQGGRNVHPAECPPCATRHLLCQLVVLPATHQRARASCPGLHHKAGFLSQAWPYVTHSRKSMTFCVPQLPSHTKWQSFLKCQAISSLSHLGTWYVCPLPPQQFKQLLVTLQDPAEILRPPRSFLDHTTMRAYLWLSPLELAHPFVSASPYLAAPGTQRALNRSCWIKLGWCWVQLFKGGAGETLSWPWSSEESSNAFIKCQRTFTA